ncbi:MAG: hypothetical protein R3211_09495 [Balneolaceae bacterium]|nr:hypothetical protein [Balneolaceae bacterium]
MEALKMYDSGSNYNMQPVLQKVLTDAIKEHDRLQETFSLMGWGDLPDALKVEIREDVAAMADELQGQYSTVDPYILKRRESVTYWVECYRDGICSLKTAIEALKVRKL